jgi:hypothetical protein
MERMSKRAHNPQLDHAWEIVDVIVTLARSYGASDGRIGFCAGRTGSSRRRSVGTK